VVKVGIRQGDDVQILEGVTANDKVIADRAFGLPDKTKIKIEAAAEAPAAGAKAPGEGSSEK
jgi:multidrug efflux pump subunit AcrA (membrane-fusion protein)